MATLDIPRAALVLSDAELGAAVMLMAAPEQPLLAEPASQEAVGALREAGMLDEAGRPSGYPARLLATVAAPKLRVAVESYFAGQSRLEQAWATETEGVLGGVTVDGRIELSPVEPSLLPWAIARWVGFGPRAHGDREALDVPGVAFSSAEEALEAGDEDAARAALEGVAGGERVLELLRLRRLSWRATSSWSDQAGDHVASVAVLDAGTAGLWLPEPRGEDPATALLHLEPVAPSAVWERIVALMPHEGAP